MRKGGGKGDNFEAFTFAGEKSIILAGMEAEDNENENNTD